MNNYNTIEFKPEKQVEEPNDAEEKIYETSFVAFIDILGFRELFKDENHRKILLELLSDFSQNNGNYYHSKVDETEEICSSVTCFSDNIVLSCSVNVDSYDDFHKKLSAILKGISFFANKALSKNYFFRGALSVGGLYHKNGTIIGEPLIDCVHHEKIAIYPRIILTSTFLEQFELYKNNHGYSLNKKQTEELYFFKKDHDGIFYFDYLSFFDKHLENNTLVYLLPNVIKHIKANIDSEKNLEVYQKLYWAYQYLEKFNKTLGYDL